MRLLHAKCSTPMLFKKNDVRVLEVVDGKLDSVWSADLWTCPKCGEEIVTGFGKRPVSNHKDSVFPADSSEAEYLMNELLDPTDCTDYTGPRGDEAKHELAHRQDQARRLK